MNIRTTIESVGHYVPQRTMTNHDLAKLMDTSDEWITERTGIKERHFVEPGGSCAELAVEAARAAIARAELNPAEIDLIIAATLSPDFYFPGIGCMVQTKLGLPQIPALDVRAQCSGFVYGLATVDAFIRSGQARTVLFVCAEVQSTRLNYTTAGRDMAVLFGDGAGALVLRGKPGEERRGVIDSLLGADGSGAEVLSLRNPEQWEFRPLPPDKTPQGWHPQMDGRQVFKHAVERMGAVAETILLRNGITADDVDLLVPHQANLRINEAVRERLGIAPERVFNNIDRYGNTTAATIPIAMSEAYAAGKLKSDDLVLTLAFGAGFTWGANLFRW